MANNLLPKDPQRLRGRRVPPRASLLTGLQMWLSSMLAGVYWFGSFGKKLFTWVWPRAKLIGRWAYRELGSAAACVLWIDVGMNLSTTLPAVLLPWPISWGVLALSQLAMLTVAIVLADRYVLRRWARMRQARLGRRILYAVSVGVLWMVWWAHK